VESHLRGKGHVARVKERIEKQQIHNSNDSATNFANFSMLAEPVVAYPNHERSQASHFLSQYLSAKHLEQSKTNFHFGMIQQMVSNVEQKIAPLEAQTTEILSISKTNEQKYQSLVRLQVEANTTYQRDYTGLDSRLVKYRDLQEDRIKEVEQALADKLIQGEQVTALDLKLDQMKEDTENKWKEPSAQITTSRCHLEDKVEKLKECLNTAAKASTCQLDDISHNLSERERSYERLNVAVEKRESHVTLLEANYKRIAIGFARQKDDDAVRNQRMVTLETSSRYHAEQIKLQEKGEELLRLKLKAQQEEGNTLH
jgi:hypothetical protein